MEVLKSSQILGNFKILELISSGGMGAVYKACHKNNPKEIFALKVIRSEFCSDTGFVSRFKQEEGLIINLSHQNIVKGFHFGVTPEGEHYFVMEYVEGEDLRARLTREKRLSIGDTLNIAGQVCSALEYAHGEGVIHRDIKPENILLKPDGTALLADFGIMKMVGEGTYHKTVTSLSRMNSGGGDSMEGRASLGRLSSASGEEEGRQSSAGGAARKGPSPGTLAYMAPEQISGDTVTARTDIYQLGAVMYECLTGEPPLGRFEDPSALNPAIVPYLEKTVLKCLKAKAANRYSSADELGRALEALVGKPGQKWSDHVSSQPPAKQSLTAKAPIQPKPEPGPEIKAAVSKPEPAPKVTAAAPKPESAAEIEVEAPKPEPVKSRSVKFWLILIVAGLLPVSIIALWLFSGNRTQSDGPLEVQPFTAKSGDTELNINNQSSSGNQTKVLNPGNSQSDHVPFSMRQQQQNSSLDLFLKANKSALEGDAEKKAPTSQANPAGSGPENPSADAKAKVGRKAAETGAASDCYKGFCNWNNAVAYCKSRGSRLPTIDELKNMYQAECTGGKRGATCDKWYWSSEESASVARSITFVDGSVYGYGKINNYNVRCR